MPDEKGSEERGRAFPLQMETLYGPMSFEGTALFKSPRRLSEGNLEGLSRS